MGQGAKIRKPFCLSNKRSELFPECGWEGPKGQGAEEDGAEPPGLDGSCGDTEKDSGNWERGGVENREGKRDRVWLLPKPL